MKVLICGDRNWKDAALIEDIVRRLPVESVVVHGAARGADTLAGLAAAKRGLAVRAYPAEWNRYGRGAGPIRNAQMLREEKIDRVLAFHDSIDTSKGTADMIACARRHGIPYDVISHSEGVRRGGRVEFERDP